MHEISVIIICGFLLKYGSGRAVNDYTEIECESLPKMILTQILGSAFNPRYMSLESPVYKKTVDAAVITAVGKRASEDEPEFYVDKEFSKIISDKPAWESNVYLDLNSEQKRIKRQLKQKYYMGSRTNNMQATSSVDDQDRRPWFCDSKIKWIDLGDDYYPRWIRTVECVKQNCWYGKYTCAPRSFTIKLLRRQSNKCIHSKKLLKMGLSSNKSQEIWIWEERAISFCCDCVSTNSNYY